MQLNCDFNAARGIRQQTELIAKTDVVRQTLRYMLKYFTDTLVDINKVLQSEILVYECTDR